MQVNKKCLQERSYPIVLHELPIKQRFFLYRKIAVKKEYRLIRWLHLDCMYVFLYIKSRLYFYVTFFLYNFFSYRERIFAWLAAHINQCISLRSRTMHNHIFFISILLFPKKSKHCPCRILIRNILWYSYISLHSFPFHNRPWIILYYLSSG